jgi:hypothetical protein
MEEGDTDEQSSFRALIQATDGLFGISFDCKIEKKSYCGAPALFMTEKQSWKC